MRVVFLVTASFILAGCSSPAPNETDSDDEIADSSASLLAPTPVPLRFAMGDYEALEIFTKTFQPTDFCRVQCQGAGMQVIDLTPQIPADAPVELAINLDADDGISTDLVFTDAQAVKESNSGLSALVIRSPAGTVQLRLTREADGRGLTGPIVAKVEVRSVVRASTLVASVPATLKLVPGDVLNFTGDGLEQALLILPSGDILRDVDGPFTLTVPNGTVGDSTLVAVGADAAVTGPNVTMTAQRVGLAVGPAHPIPSTGKVTWEFTTDTVPVRVGVQLHKVPTASFVSASALGSYSIKITAPGNVVILETMRTCAAGAATCLSQGSFSTTMSFNTPNYHEHLKAGAYKVEISGEQSVGYEAMEAVLEIL